MSQSAVRASAREIRRAFGPAAVEHLDLQALKVESVARSVNLVSQRLDHSEAVQRDHVAALNRLLDAVEGRSFWGRLRWLFTGK